MLDLRRRSVRALDILKHVSGRSFGAVSNTLLLLYKSLVRSKLDYGCQLYSSASESVLARLEPVQNTALRIASGAFRSSPVRSLQSLCGVPPLQYHREVRLLQSFIRLSGDRHSSVFRLVDDSSRDGAFDRLQRTPVPMGVQVRRLGVKYSLPSLEVLGCTFPSMPPW